MPRKDIIMISECISAPFDEGFKNVIYNLARSLSQRDDALVLTRAENNTKGLNVGKVEMNKLFLNKALRSALKENAPKLIFYVPEASHTFNSFIRGRILKIWSRGAKIIILGLQYRNISAFSAGIIANFLRPDLLLLLGKKGESYFCEKGFNVKVLPPAVDRTIFRPASGEAKKSIRADYNIPAGRKVVLHVGHIKASRNVQFLIEIQKIDNIQVVVVGSTSTEKESEIKNRMTGEGILVIDKYIQDMSVIYKMSDIYVFPVQMNTAAIDMPLSVLEALACNLPVITTRFGGLVDFFEEDSGFKYFDTNEELVKLIVLMDGTAHYDNVKKIERFSWDRFSDEVIAACRSLV